MNTLRILALACCALPLAAAAEALDIQSGAWEITTRLSQPRRTQVETRCLPEHNLLDLVHAADLVEDDPCHPLGTPKTSRNTWSAVLNCEDGSQLHARFTTRSARELSGTVVRVGGRRALLQKQELKGRWLRTDCAARPAAKPRRRGR